MNRRSASIIAAGLVFALIAWAHLKELPDYYERLEAMERNDG
jgi:multisubunit Na+/H+ antiporter MnhG subunit